MARKVVGRKGPDIISGTEKQVREMAVGSWEGIKHLPRAADVMLREWMRERGKRSQRKGLTFLAEAGGWWTCS